MGTEKMKFYERYKIFIILCFVNIATFMVRFALTVAILDMADPPSKNSTDSKSCPSNHTPPTSQKFTKSSRNVADIIGARYVIFFSLFGHHCFRFSIPLLQVTVLD